MTSATIGNLTIAIIFLVVVFTVIGFGYVLWIFGGFVADRYDQWRMRRVLRR